MRIAALLKPGALTLFQARKGYGDIERQNIVLIYALTLDKLHGSTFDEAVIGFG